MPKKNVDKPDKIKTPLEELEVLSQLKNTTYWAIFKRLADRYINNVIKLSFNIPKSDIEKFTLEHTRYFGQVEGIKMLIKLVEESGKKAEELDR